MHRTCLVPIACYHVLWLLWRRPPHSFLLLTLILPNPHQHHHYSHFHMECSNSGVCNRGYEDGVCECFPGYTGAACERMECPDDCSGHGVCLDVLGLARAQYHALGCTVETVGYDCGVPMRAPPKGMPHEFTAALVFVFLRVSVCL